MQIHPGNRVVVAQTLSPVARDFLGRLPRQQAPDPTSSWLLVTGRPAGPECLPWYGHVRLLRPEPSEVEELPGIGLFEVPIRLQFALTERATFRVTNIEVPPSLRRRGLASEYVLRAHDTVAPGLAWEFDSATSSAGRAWREAMRTRV